MGAVISDMGKTVPLNQYIFSDMGKTVPLDGGCHLRHG